VCSEQQIFDGFADVTPDPQSAPDVFAVINSLML
jgi:hypothetical protein